MKKTRFTMAMAVLSATVLGMASCAKDGGTTERPTPERCVTLNFTTTPMSDVTTRSAATADENRIARVAIFGIDAEGNVIQTLPIIESPATSGNTVSLIEGVKELRLIANPKGEHTLSYSTAAEFDDLQVNFATAPSTPFVMAGKVAVNSATLTVPMERAVAKLSVVGAGNFDVTEVAVSRTPSWGYLYSRAQLPSFGDSDYVGYPTVHGSEVYVGENSAAAATTLAVKGLYNGREILYNVLLKKDGAPVEVRRNNNYIVTVRPVNETDCDVDVVIADWNDVTLDDGVFTPTGKYYSVDFHNHTGYTDGSEAITFVLNQGKKYGLDIIVNSEHGGSDPHNASEGDTEGLTMPTWTSQGIIPAGTPNNGNMWRWESIMNYSWRKIQEFNQNNGVTILAVQGLEWNPPGHEHCSSGVITGQFDGGNNARAMAQFEYMFDNSDNDKIGGAEQGWVKSTKTGHAKSVEAAAWMQKNHPHTSWLVPAHPERQNLWKIEHYRELNDVAPDVFVGFESVPGHQASTGRGGYGNTSSYEKTYTFGGVGVQSAKIGGLWDAMISEGRRFWLVANSDYHAHVNRGTGDFYPGEYQKTYISMNDKSAQAFVDGLRAGNIYTVHGDLIDNLQFSVSTATMGQTLVTSNNDVKVTVIMRDPNTDNNNTYSSLTNPTLDHVDIIAGGMRAKVAQGSSEYTKATYDDVRVVARFDAVGGVSDTKGITSMQWEDLGDGFIKIEYTHPLAGDTYFRLRGTNHGLNTPGETDGDGNPLVDQPTADVQAGAASAFEDLWFYSNPIFVKKI